MPARASVRGPGLRLRLTVLSTVLVALVSALLLYLGWLLVGDVAASVPSLPPGTTVRVGELDVPAAEVTRAVGAAARAEVLRAGLIAFPLVVAAAGLVAWVLAGRILAPLHAVTAAARRLSAESLDERIALRDARGEVAELAASFDAMLDRLQAAFTAQRRFVANASHELRTPLAVLRTEVDVTLADPAADVAELRRMGDVVRDATRRADDLVGGLLLLARAEALGARALSRRPVDLCVVAKRAVAVTAAEARAKGVRVQVGGGAAPVSGDLVLLERVAGNLLENAVRHNVEGGWIEVRTGVRDGASELCVASGGAEIPVDRVAELFEPFRRGPVARTGSAPGSGLGLSIVRAVVTAHQGEVTADPLVGGGLRVTVTLPAAR
ncbi:MAG: HAMP domain-containing histidine kinase [Pseudonocardia sp.]|nr:HAMP domain-containing histidine kinase [Pseudonocardia sp.]